jgi:preprotein translocase subunit YajC
MAPLFVTIPLLLAQKAAAGQAPSPLATWLPLLPIPILLYFLLLRPQQQQERKRKEMLSSLKKNDKVLTTAGIYGTVISLDDANDKVVVRVEDGIKLTFTKASIVRVLEPAQE